MNEILLAILLSILLTGIAYAMAEFFLKLFKINHPKNAFFVYFLVFLFALSFVPLTVIGITSSHANDMNDSSCLHENMNTSIALENITQSSISSKITPLPENGNQQASETIPSRFILEISWYDFIPAESTVGIETTTTSRSPVDHPTKDKKEDSSVLATIMTTIGMLPPILFSLFALIIVSIFFPLYQLFFGKKRYLAKIQAHPANDTKLNHIVKNLAQQLHIKTPKICLYHGAPNAFVLGHPSILVISDRLPVVLSENELKTTLRHELTHIKHHDILLKAFIQASRILCFFNPFVHLAAKKIFNKRELLADASYNTSHGDRVSFMEALVKIAEYTQSLSTIEDKKTPAISVSLLNLTSYHPTLSERFISLFKQCRKKTIITLFVSLIILFAQGSALLFTQSYLQSAEDISQYDSDLVNVEEQYIVEDVAYTTLYQNHERLQGKMVHKTLYNIVSLPSFSNNSNLREIITYILLQYYQNQQASSAF
ncbi:MAG: M56 family metallopeptidase [Thermoplasmatota archaeon]